MNYTISAVRQLFEFSSSGLRNYNRACGDAADMIEILERESDVRDPAEPERSRIGAGEVRFEGVTFQHAGSRDTLFDGLNLRIEPGERVGLVGHSGAGKTSFTRLLLRFSDLNGARILLDGQGISRITQADLRGAIAYVPQEPLLFHRSISDNIAYGRLDADQAGLSTIQRMDRIIVLDQGRIVEMGTHSELLDNPDGVYASFWAHQSGGFLQGDSLARA